MPIFGTTLSPLATSLMHYNVIRYVEISLVGLLIKGPIPPCGESQGDDRIMLQWCGVCVCVCVG